jgi:hypothetical protein
MRSHLASGKPRKNVKKYSPTMARIQKQFPPNTTQHHATKKADKRSGK